MGLDPRQGVFSFHPKQCVLMKRDELGVEEEPEAKSESWNRIQILGTRKANTSVGFIVHVAFYHISYYKDEKKAHLDWATYWRLKKETIGHWKDVSLRIARVGNSKNVKVVSVSTLCFFTDILSDQID